MDDAPEDDAGDLDALVRRVDPDRWMSSRFIADAQARADVITLYAFDHELARAPKVASNPLIGEIRLTWWREALEEMFEGRPVRRHPTAQALAEVIARRGLARDALEALVEARYRELDPAPMAEAEALVWARDSGGQVAALAAALLDRAGDAEAARAAGAAWALGRRHDPLFAAELVQARVAVRRLSASAFPAVAHAALSGRPHEGDVTKYLKLTWAVARGRI
ncbi:squalene/phytoene synthase family protein [Phenylobacterium sp.]|uniref:squalene/phytoene synthase family protein n=1 Tax=Phenylobacterium sp. TaxID=1871053 RepID=UPI002DE3B9A7|nr:squalene/phytoene synthase family protein [Phenylobacterium sp.]